MNANPVIGANISQTLFKQNEHLVVPSDSVSVGYQNLSSLSGINSMPQELNNMQNQMPAFLSQAHLSTWYQDNPWETLTYTKNYGVPPMGGNLDLEQPPGHKPGNTLRRGLIPVLPSPSHNLPSAMQNMKSTGIMREGFENYDSGAPIKIHWQYTNDS
jgi:hypothetical protein